MPRDKSLATPYDRDAKRRLREPGISRLDRIPIRESSEPLVSLVGLSPRLRLRAPIPWVRKSVAAMLVKAAESLPEGMFLTLGTGLRSLKMQSRSYRWFFRRLRRQHPTWPPGVLRREANRFLHPPDSVSPPGHCTGGAVDVVLTYRNGRQVDTFSSVIPKAIAWATFYPHLTPQARANRALLYNAMIAAGFTNCYDEWWHYSYGDTGWAARAGRRQASYGLPEKVPLELQRVIGRAEKKPPRRRLKL